MDAMDKSEKSKKILIHALLFNLLFSAVGIVYGAVTLGRFTLNYFFTANFIAGAFILLAGVIVFIIPVRPKGKLIDHSTVGEELMQMKEKKRKKAFEIIFLGMCIVLIPAFIQLLLSVAI